MLQSKTPNGHFTDQKKPPYIPSSFQYDPSAISPIDTRNQSYSISTYLANPTPEQKSFNTQDSISKKSKVQVKVKKYHAKSKSLSIMESVQKPISCGSSPKQPTKHLDAYVMRVREILDKGSKSLKEKEDQSAKMVSNYIKQDNSQTEINIFDTSRSKSLPKFRAKEVKTKKSEISASQFDVTFSPILKAARPGSILELGHNQHELDAFPLTLSHKPYWQDQSFMEIKEESTFTSSPINKETKMKINKDQILKKNQTSVNIKKVKPANQDSKENTLELLFPNRKETTVIFRKSVSTGPGQSNNLSKPLNISPSLKPDVSGILDESKIHARSYIQRENSPDVSSFSKEIERLKESDSPQLGKSISHDVFVQEPGSSFFQLNPDNKRLEEFKKLYKVKETNGNTKEPLIDPSNTRAEILQKVRIMDELIFNQKAVAVTVAKGKEIIQPNFMQKRGSMCYTELWGAKEASKVTKKLLKCEVNHLDLRHLKRDCESIYRPFKWEKEKSFSRKLPRDDNDPRSSLENSLGKFNPGHGNRRSQSFGSVSMISGANHIGKVSLEKTAIIKDISLCERASKSLVSSREGSPISSLRARIAENAAQLESQQKELLQKKLSLLNDGDIIGETNEVNTKKRVEFIIEEKVENKTRIVPLRKKKNLPGISQAEKMAKFSSFIKEHTPTESQASGQQLKKKISQIIANKRTYQQ